MRPFSYLSSIINSERTNLIFFFILSFVAGCSFYIFFSLNCDFYLSLLLIIFGAILILYSLDYKSFRGLIYLLWLIFLVGIFYGKFFVTNFTKNTHFSQKLYIKGSGKIIATKDFYNPVNKKFGINVIIETNSITKLKFNDNQKNLIQNKSKAKKKTTKNLYKKKNKKIKKKNPRKASKNKKKSAEKNNDKKNKNTKPRKKKVKKISKNFAKKIYKNFVNVKNYQEIDRLYLDFKKDYGNGSWVAQGTEFILPNPPQKISLNLANPKQKLNVNDEISFNATIEPINAKDFPESYNLKFDALAKNIDGFGFFIDQPIITKSNNINDFEDWFNNLRDKIRYKIQNHLQGDSAGIIMALLIGDQNHISTKTLTAIRNSGLSHLLSISGFHLSFASAIFFMSSRFLLIRINFIALRYDIKKISAFLAIFISYFYLKIAGSPIPAKRALIMVWLVSLSLILDKKFNGKRALFLALLILTLINPFNLFQISFLLSFLGVLVIIIYYEDWRQKIFPHANLDADANFITDILSKIKLYFCEIIFITFIIQIASLPILMNNFQIFSFSAFGANLLAIPLVSFIILPLGFLLLFMMALKLEIIIFWPIKIILIFFIKIIYFFADFKFAFITTPLLSNTATAFCLISCVIFLLSRTKFLRLLMAMIFLINIASSFIAKPNQIIFDKSQKFYAIYYNRNLYFSKKLKMTKQVKSWMKIYNVKNFLTLKDYKNKNKDDKSLHHKCFKNYCIINLDGNNILSLTRRNKITKICKIVDNNNFDLIVNFTKKYTLPDCIKKHNKIHKIDNLDFIAKSSGAKAIILPKF